MQDSNHFSQNAIELVQLRNGFYRNKYHQILAFYLLSLIVIIILIWLLIFFIKNIPNSMKENLQIFAL